MHINCYLYLLILFSVFFFFFFFKQKTAYEMRISDWSSDVCSSDLGVDGMVHLSDLDWNKPGEQAITEYQKGQVVQAQVLDIDVEKERISLGIDRKSVV